MTDAQPAADQRIVLRDDTAAYAVPAVVLEEHRATPQQRASFEAAMRDTEGFQVAAETPVYLPPQEALAPYRMDEEQRDAIDAALRGGDADVQGFQYIGQFPGVVYVAPREGGPAAARSQVYFYASAYWFNSGGGASRNGPYPGLH